MEWLKGKKTYIISGLLMIVGIIQVVSGDMSFQQFMQSPAAAEIMASLGLVASRVGSVKE